MAKKDRNKRAARKARQAERQRNEAIAQAQAAAGGSKAPVKAASKNEAKTASKAAKQGKPGIVKRVRSYFGEVRSEMRRVVWPSREDLKNYTVAVICILLVFGVAVWLIDSGVVAALIGFSGLRG